MLALFSRLPGLQGERVWMPLILAHTNRDLLLTDAKTPVPM